MSEPEVIIVGGGIAGLACALRLHENGIAFRLYEAGDAVGGRVRTDQVDGFRLDRGFQVLLTAYPEAKRILSFSDLKLHRFEPGALVRFQGKFHRFVDPWRRPRHLLSTALSPLATLADKFRVARLRRRVCHCSLDELFLHPETTTLERLEGLGFSPRIIERFFRPFLGGVFLEPGLATSSRKFEFVFRMFCQGDAALPQAGMEEIARQLAGRLPENAIQTKSQVEEVKPDSIRLASGETHSADYVVLAVDAPTASRLTGEESPPSCHVTCVYFTADRPPVREPILVLNGDGEGPINNLCVPSQVSATYAPPGKSLISVSILKDSASDERLLQDVINQLRDWFGAEVDDWRHLRTYRIPFALPAQPSLDPAAKPVSRTDGLLVCGDHLDMASLQGAMNSWRRAAERVISSVAEGA